VARAALAGGSEALQQLGIQLFRPVQPSSGARGLRAEAGRSANPAAQVRRRCTHLHP
jgi:hypothetical protein